MAKQQSQKLPSVTWCTASVCPQQLGKLRRMPTDCHKLRVFFRALSVYRRCTHTHTELSCVSVCCYGVQWSKEALSSPEVWVKACQLQRGNDLKHLDTMSILEKANMVQGWYTVNHEMDLASQHNQTGNWQVPASTLHVLLITFYRSYFDK